MASSSPLAIISDSDFSGTAERKISAEYRVTRHLLLKGEQVQRPPQKDRAETQYNLDLKIRFEY